MKETTRECLALAEKDLQAAEILLKEQHLANIVMFHCQQCV